MITHPFSPQKGQEYIFVDRVLAWGEDRIICCDEDGNSRSFLTSWTDYPTADPLNLISEPVDFLFDDLQMLANLILDVKKL